MHNREVDGCKPDHDPVVRIEVSIPDQLLRMKRNGVEIAAYPVSTSKFGIGSEEGSFKTPTGRFRIVEKIGHGAESYTVFKGRKPTGEIARQGGDEDHVLTRILWLDGLEPHNANTKSRYVYIHGTNQEARIGQPASHGCIRMKNADLLQLFEATPVGTEIVIVA